jgi:hypothetical protein
MIGGLKKKEKEGQWILVLKTIGQRKQNKMTLIYKN